MVKTGVPKTARPAFPRAEHSVCTLKAYSSRRPINFILLLYRASGDTFGILKNDTGVPYRPTLWFPAYAPGVKSKAPAAAPCTPNVPDVPTPMIPLIVVTLQHFQHAYHFGSRTKSRGAWHISPNWRMSLANSWSDGFIL